MNILNMKVMRAVTASLALVLAPTMACRADDERQSVEELRNTVINLLQALVDQGVITKEKAQQMVKSAQSKAAVDNGATAKEEEGAVRVPYVPQIVQDQIAKQVAEQVKPAVVADVVKQGKALPDWVTRLHVFGDITVREQNDIYSKGNAANELLDYY